MSELNFKKFSDLDVLENISATSHVVVEEDGDVKRFPANGIGKVKTVNGAEPDENGNINILAWEETTLSDTLVWDGNTEGLLCVSVELDGEMMPLFYKVSDAVPTRQDFSTGFLAIADDGSSFLDSRDASEGEINRFLDEFFWQDGFFRSEGFFIVPTDNYVWESEDFLATTFPEAGIYVMNPEINGFFMQSLTLPGYGKFEGMTVKPIDPKYLPECVVKTVNNTEPDENGNVTIEAGGVSSWNDLEDKPFYSEFAIVNDRIIWDGNIEGLEGVEGFAYLVSDVVPDIEDFRDSFILTYCEDGKLTTYDYTELEEWESYFEQVKAMMQECDGAIIFEDFFVIPRDGFEIEGLTFPKAGVYFPCESLPNYLQSLIIPGFERFSDVTVENITPLNEKYIPETIASKEYVKEALGGEETEAIGDYSRAEGASTQATGDYSHAEGYYSHAEGLYSHAEGYGTIASRSYQHVEGMYNIQDTEDKYLHIVGKGSGEDMRSNAYTLDTQGNGWFSGGLKVGGSSQEDENATSVLTMADIDTIVQSVIDSLRSNGYIQ